MINEDYDEKQQILKLASGELSLPVYFPDATFGFVRSLDTADLNGCGIQGVVMNTFHLMKKPGVRIIKQAGGLHKYFNWQKPIITDSGGFQIYSLIRQNKNLGQISSKGIIYRPEGEKRKMLLSPEKIIRTQLNFASDIVICLDDCTHMTDCAELNREAVARTIAWAGRCRKEFDRVLAGRHSGEKPPLLFAVVQGGNDFELRRRCAGELLEIGFDGFGFGGYPLDENNKLMTEILQYVSELIPAGYPLFALGIGHPYHLAHCIRFRYNLFDCSLPTRDARYGRLYVLKTQPADLDFSRQNWFTHLYPADTKHFADLNCLAPGCDCHTCRNYSVSFMHHLFKRKDTLFYRLATIHNLRTMSRLTDEIRKRLKENRL